MQRRVEAARDHVFMVRTNAPMKWPDFHRVLRIALEAVIQPYDGAEAVIWKVPQPKFKKRVAVSVEVKTSPRQTLDAIVKLLDREEWGPDTLDAIAAELRAGGFEIRDPEER